MMANQTQSFLIVKILSCLGSLPQDFGPRRVLQRYLDMAPTAMVGTRQVTGSGLGLLGLGHLLACSPEIAFHLHKLRGVFLLFLQLLLLQFKLNTLKKYLYTGTF